MTTYFISDLHLSPLAPEITALFKQFTASLKPKDTLYILGDFFEAWVGDDAASEFDLHIMEILKTLTNHHIHIFMLYGNRDFLMRHTFFKATGVTFIQDETVIELNNEKILLMHGDTLCTTDIHYQRYRKMVRNRLIQFLFLKLPVNTRKKIALKLRSNSQRRYQENQTMIDVTQKAVMTVMKKHKVSQLIHGHTHNAAVHQFTIDGQIAKRIVLGAWHEVGSYIQSNANQAPTLETFSLTTGPE